MISENRLKKKKAIQNCQSTCCVYAINYGYNNGHQQQQQQKTESVLIEFYVNVFVAGLIRKTRKKKSTKQNKNRIRLNTNTTTQYYR